MEYVGFIESEFDAENPKENITLIVEEIAVENAAIIEENETIQEELLQVDPLSIVNKIEEIEENYEEIDQKTVQILEINNEQYTYIIANEENVETTQEHYQITSEEAETESGDYLIENYVQNNENNDEDDSEEYETVYIETEEPDDTFEEPVFLLDKSAVKEEIKSPSKVKNSRKKKHKKEPSPEEEEEVEENMELIYECGMCSKIFKRASAVKRHISLMHPQVEEEEEEAEDIIEEKSTTNVVESVKDELTFSLCYCCGEPSDTAHTNGEFSCQECGNLFSLKKSLYRHQSIEHPIKGKFSCYECKKEFDNKMALINHSKMHSLKCVKCETCGKEFSRQFHLDRHVMQTGCMGTSKQVYECRVCQKSFTRKDNLGQHLKIHAGLKSKKNPQFTCQYCMKEFGGNSLLQIHIRTHTGEKPYDCDICKRSFPSSGAMKKHRRKHTGEKPYVCPECGKNFAAKETLNRHWRIHTGDKPHQCKYCGKGFIQATQLRAHIFHHTGENAYTCPFCSRAFNRKLRLTTHIKFIHDGAHPIPCTVEGCTKTFFRKEDLRRHGMLHTGEKPHKCETCGKAFVMRSSLNMHKNTHKTEKPIRCEVCNRTFIRKDCLMRHMRAKHRDVIEDIVASTEKRRLERLYKAVSSSTAKDQLESTPIWTELTLTDSVKELLTLLVSEECLRELGLPETPVDRVLESVIRRCGHEPALDNEFDYIGRMRENAKLLFTVVINDQALRELLENQSIDEVIVQVLKLARKEADVEEEEENVDVKPTIVEQIEDDEAETEATNEEEEEEESSNILKFISEEQQ